MSTALNDDHQSVVWFTLLFLFYSFQEADSTKEVDPLGNHDWYLLDVPLTRSGETQDNGTGSDCLPFLSSIIR